MYGCICTGRLCDGVPLVTTCSHAPYVVQHVTRIQIASGCPYSTNRKRKSRKAGKRPFFSQTSKCKTKPLHVCTNMFTNVYFCRIKLQKPTSVEYPFKRIFWPRPCQHEAQIDLSEVPAIFITL